MRMLQFIYVQVLPRCIKKCTYYRSFHIIKLVGFYWYRTDIKSCNSFQQVPIIVYLTSRVNVSIEGILWHYLAIIHEPNENCFSEFYFNLTNGMNTKYKPDKINSFLIEGKVLKNGLQSRARSCIILLSVYVYLMKDVYSTELQFLDWWSFGRSELASHQF
jgi:hypothetical protein